MLFLYKTFFEYTKEYYLHYGRLWVEPKTTQKLQHFMAVILARFHSFLTLLKHCSYPAK